MSLYKNNDNQLETIGIIFNSFNRIESCKALLQNVTLVLILVITQALQVHPAHLVVLPQVKASKGMSESQDSREIQEPRVQREIEEGPGRLDQMQHMEQRA